jgi:hypothetical protein
VQARNTKVGVWRNELTPFGVSFVPFAENFYDTVKCEIYGSLSD